MELITKNSFKIGKVYKINHTKKGSFIARVTKFLPGDDLDPFILEVEYDTRKDSDQAHMRTSGNKRTSGLRPSFITGIREVPDEEWNRKIIKSVPTVERKTIKDLIPKWMKGK